MEYLTTLNIALGLFNIGLSSTRLKDNVNVFSFLYALFWCLFTSLWILLLVRESP